MAMAGSQSPDMDSIELAWYVLQRRVLAAKDDHVQNQDVSKYLKGGGEGYLKTIWIS